MGVPQTLDASEMKSDSAGSSQASASLSVCASSTRSAVRAGGAEVDA
jgi:hypothetical protein